MNKTNIPVPQLPRSLPEEQGIQSSAVSAFLNRIKESQLALHSFMLLRHGHVVTEGWWTPYSPERRHMLFSLSKSFTSTAIGLAAAEQLLSLEDKVISFFPEEAPENPGSKLAGMNIRHLLMMGTGHTSDTMPEMLKDAGGNWVRAFLQLPVEQEPGSHFLYNTGATYMLSAILQKVTGQTLLDYLHPRLFSPLGIADPVWESCPRGINTGGYGLSITTEDIAKFGQLYLQKGLWNGRQVIPQEWVAEASALQIANGDGKPESGDWSQGYGYQFWRCRHGIYRGDGAFGQFCIVMPEQDAVVAITSGTNELQEVMNAVMELLLPALNDGKSTPVQQPAAAELADQLRSLAIMPPVIRSVSALEQELSGRICLLESNELQIESLAIDFADKEARLTLQGPLSGCQEILLGRGQWAASQLKLTPDPSAADAVMSSFTWTAEDMLQLTLLMVEQPFIFTLDITFNEQSLTLTQSANVGMGAQEPVTIQGTLQA
ncbi:serine hydrolase [Paenibacillus sp. FSL R7-0345]|uniref:serine hydrolase domain-containing protein n=1 Tax=Paenibacillus sp. FSL R7-0345 TaxID=2954535 RepID=UPI00315A7A87